MSGVRGVHCLCVGNRRRVHRRQGTTLAVPSCTAFSLESERPLRVVHLGPAGRFRISPLATQAPFGPAVGGRDAVSAAFGTPMERVCRFASAVGKLRILQPRIALPSGGAIGKRSNAALTPAAFERVPFILPTRRITCP